MKKIILGVIGVCAMGLAQADTVVLSLPQVMERAMTSDPRITEKEKLVDAARALLQEAQGGADWSLDLNATLGLSPQIKGGISSSGGNVVIPDDALDYDGVGPWYYLELAAIKPLYTFGKVEHYSQAARGNIQVKQGDVELQRQEITLQATQAYYGYLAARDTRLLLEDSQKQLRSALELVENWLNNDTGKAKQSDMFALQTGIALLQRYIAEASSYEQVAMAGLRLLAGIDEADTLEVADQRLTPVPLPDEGLAELQDRAMLQRPEIQQLSAGLEARRAWMSAKRSEAYPNLYAGIVGIASISPLRDDISSANVYDPFNSAGATPVLGLKWDWNAGRQPAQVAQAQAELESTLALNSYARKGIPFEVEEQYRTVHAHHAMVESLYDASRSSRRWMITTYTDFEAGVEDGEKIINAMLAYIQAYSDYLKITNDYNVHVARLRIVSGKPQ